MTPMGGEEEETQGTPLLDQRGPYYHIFSSGLTQRSAEAARLTPTTLTMLDTVLTDLRRPLSNVAVEGPCQEVGEKGAGSAEVYKNLLQEEEVSARMFVEPPSIGAIRLHGVDGKGHIIDVSYTSIGTLVRLLVGRLREHVDLFWIGL